MLDDLDGDRLLDRRGVGDRPVDCCLFLYLGGGDCSSGDDRQNQRHAERNGEFTNHSRSNPGLDFLDLVATGDLGTIVATGDENTS